MTEDTMTPGSHVARRSGCTCDMIRNQYGKGCFTSSGGAVQYDVDPKCKWHGHQQRLVGTPCE